MKITRVALRQHQFTIVILALLVTLGMSDASNSIGCILADHSNPTAMAKSGEAEAIRLSMASISPSIESGVVTMTTCTFWPSSTKPRVSAKACAPPSSSRTSTLFEQLCEGLYWG